MKEIIQAVASPVVHTTWAAKTGILVFAFLLIRDLVLESVPTLMRLWAVRR